MNSFFPETSRLTLGAAQPLVKRVPDTIARNTGDNSPTMSNAEDKNDRRYAFTKLHAFVAHTSTSCIATHTHTHTHTQKSANPSTHLKNVIDVPTLVLVHINYG